MVPRDKLISFLGFHFDFFRSLFSETKKGVAFLFIFVVIVFCSSIAISEPASSYLKNPYSMLLFLVLYPLSIFLLIREYYLFTPEKSK
jgi:hypothetical protein